MAIMRKEAKSKRKREEKLRKGKESERKREEKRGKGKKSGKKGKKEKKAREKEKKAREKEKRSALSSLQKTKRSAYGLVAQGLRPMQPGYFDILALAFSTSSSLGRGSFLASITTWKTKSVTHFCEKPKRWLY